MSASVFYRQIGLENKLSSINKKLDKKIFYDYAELNKKEKDVIAKYIERMELTYLLTPATINIQPYINEEYHYEGVMFITVSLREGATDKQIKIIDEVIHGALPNPAVITFRFNEKILISSCMKRLNKVDKSSVVLAEINRTPWLNIEAKDHTLNKFVESIHLTKITFTNFFELYKDIDLAIQAFQEINITGSFQVIKDDQKREQQHLIIQQVKEIEQEVIKLKVAIKKETQFNKKVELNVKVHKLTKKINNLKKELL